MKHEDLKAYVRRNWRDVIGTMTYPARDRVNDEESWTCPLCGHGNGGDGLTFNPNSRDRNGLKCFGCGFSGDVIDLYQQVNGCGFNDALRALGAELGETLDDDQPEQTAPAQTTTPGQGDLSAYFKECRARLRDPEAVAYLTGRGISVETADKCGVGYDPKADPAGKGHKEKRIIIPSSKTHYVGRSINPDTPDNYKKLNNKGGKAGIFNDIALIMSEKVFVVEGAFDALSIIEAGGAAIALNSTSNVRLLLSRLETIHPDPAFTLLLCLDGDDAGRKATEELRAGLTRLNVSYIAADILGGAKDPNAALVADREKFVAAVRKAEELATARPDSITAYIDQQMKDEIQRFKAVKYTGFPDLDRKAGGLYSGLYVVAAISSLGKTTFCHQLCDQLAEHGEDVLFFSLEQSRLELVSKSLSRITAQTDPTQAVTSLVIRRGSWTPPVQAALKEYRRRVQDRLSIIEGNFNCTVSFIGDYVRNYVRRNGVRPVVCVDYLQVIQPEKQEHGRGQTVRETIDATVTALKQLSRELDLTIFIVSSVNRSNYLTPIDFESLKESGGIEYTADVVWGLQLQCLNDEVFDKENKLKEKRALVRAAKAANPRKIELVCLKNRYGTSSFSCHYDYDPAHDLFIEELDLGDFGDMAAPAPAASMVI